MRATSIVTKGSIAAAALLAVASAGCGDLRDIAQDILNRSNAGTGATCVYEGAPYAPGETFFSNDGCTCQCDKSGTVGCSKTGCGSPPSSTSCVENKTPYYAECMAPESLLKIAEQDCSKQNRTFGGLNASDECGNKTYHFATYKCCDPAGSSQTCTKIDGGGGPTSCKPMSTWKTYGAEACNAQGMALTDISYQSGCDKTGENYGNAVYVCCGSTPPAPPTPSPSPCTKVGGGGGPGSCKPLSVWKSYGGEACTSLGMSLTSYSGQGACDEIGESFQDAVYVCCGGPADSDGIKCTTGANADGSKCDSCWDSSGALIKTSCAANM